MVVVNICLPPTPVDDDFRVDILNGVQIELASRVNIALLTGIWK